MIVLLHIGTFSKLVKALMSVREEKSLSPDMSIRNARLHRRTYIFIDVSSLLAYSLFDGTVGVYNEGVRLWRIKVK